MDRKNTMLLTVIAVATLLVAVVGATFAFYSVTSANTSSTRTVTTSTPQVGSVALTSTGNDLYLHITGDQMADTTAAKRIYYHQESDIAAAETATPSAVANFKVTGSDATTTYSCKADYSITSTGTMTELTGDNALQAADAGLTLTVGTATGSTPTFGNLPSGRQALTTTFSTGLTGTITFQVTGNTDVNIMAQGEFDTTRLQNPLANKSMVTSIDFTNLRCLTGSTFPTT